MQIKPLRVDLLPDLSYTHPWYSILKYTMRSNQVEVFVPVCLQAGRLVYLNVCLAMIEDGTQPDMTVLHISPHGATITSQPL